MMTTDERRLLELLAESPNGATKALLIAQGLVARSEGRPDAPRLAHSAAPSAALPAGSQLEATRVRTTEDARRALAARS
jgi:hypothetical protein